MNAALPKIVSVDDHVVEPAHVWQTWLPEKHRALGPRSERRYSAGERPVGGGAFAESWADEGKPVDCWIYEDRLAMVHRRMFAAVGFPRDEMKPLAMSYDEMRPGCYEPKGRASPTWTTTGSRRRCASRPSPASAGRRSSRARTATSASRPCARQRHPHAPPRPRALTTERFGVTEP